MSQSDSFLGLSRTAQLVAIGAIGVVLVIVGAPIAETGSIWPFAIGVVFVVYALVAGAYDVVISRT